MPKYLINIGGGIGPDVYDREVWVEAETIKKAFEQAEIHVSYDEEIYSVEHEDCLGEITVFKTPSVGPSESLPPGRIEMISKGNNQWQPIETAPKDGRSILGYADDEITVVSWFVLGKYWSLDVPGEYAEDGEWTPTHWMPVPEKPDESI